MIYIEFFLTTHECPCPNNSPKQSFPFTEIQYPVLSGIPLRHDTGLNSQGPPDQPELYDT